MYKYLKISTLVLLFWYVGLRGILLAMSNESSIDWMKNPIGTSIALCSLVYLGFAYAFLSIKKPTYFILATLGLFLANLYCLEEMTKLFNDRSQNTLVAQKLIPFAEINESIWQISADIFVPAAASRLVTKEQVEKMIGSGLSVIACGANVPFADQEIFFGPISDFADDHLSIIPDFIANCGMARVFAYLMQPGVSMTDEAIFNDTSAIIKKAIQKTYDNNNAKKGIAKTSFEIALKQLV